MVVKNTTVFDTLKINMKNIIKKLVLLTTVFLATIAFSPKSKAADVDGWVSYVSRLESYVYPSIGFQDLKSKTFTQTYYQGTYGYVTEYYKWTNGVPVSGYPTVNYNSFSYSFDNFAYTEWNGDNSHFESAETRLSLKNNTSSSKTVTITVTGTAIDSEGNATGSFYSGVSVVIPAYTTVVLNPVSGTYRYGTVSWQVVYGL